MRYKSYGPGLKNKPLTDGQDGDNVHVVVDQLSSKKARQFKISWQDISKFIFT